MFIMTGGRRWTPWRRRVEVFNARDGDDEAE
jgi:hypothetical protein